VRKVDEIAHSATPLGTLGDTYNDITLDLKTGDTLLFMSDGFPELMDTPDSSSAMPQRAMRSQQRQQPATPTA